MERSKMLELWRNEFEEGYHKWFLPPSVYDYFDGKTDNVDLSKTARYYASYDSWLVKELDGENAELARRMLMTISKIRRDGIITSSWRMMEEFDVCYRIGYDFDTLLKNSVVKFHKDIKPKTLYNVAERLTEKFPEESETFASLLITDLDDLVEKRKANSMLYLALYIAVILIRKGHNIEGRKESKLFGLFKKDSGATTLQSVLLSIHNKAGGEFIFSMYYFGIDAIPEFKDLLIEQFEKDTNSALLFWSLTNDKMKEALSNIGYKSWPYYYMVATRVEDKQGRCGTLRKLYSEDRDTFIEVYQRLKKTSSVYAYHLLAIMLKGNDVLAKAESEELNSNSAKLLLLMKRIFEEYAKNYDSNSVLTMMNDVNSPVEQCDVKIDYDRSLQWGWNGENTIAVFSVLFDYIPVAKRVIPLLLKNKKICSYDDVSIIAGYFLKARKEWLLVPPAESLETLFSSGCGFSIEKAFEAYCYSAVHNGSVFSVVSEAITDKMVEANKQHVLDLLLNNKMSVEEMLIWVDFVFVDHKMPEYESLVSLLQHKSKLVAKKVTDMIFEKEEQTRPILEAKMPGFKSEALAIAKQILKRWDNDRLFGNDFQFTNDTVVAYCTENFDKINEKFIDWIPSDMFDSVRFADLSAKAPAIVVRYVISEYMALKEPYRITGCDKVVEALSSGDFQKTMENIFLLWKDSGADAKKKMIMVPYCIYASDSQILKLKNQLKDWADAMRGALAAFVVNAIVMNGGSVALMMIDGIGVKFPNNQVKNAAKAAFVYAAKALGIPEDELSDKIVPTLGFSKEGEKVLDYGERTFTVNLMPDFSLTIFDNARQKEIKSLPSPAAGDDTVKATAAKKEFSELKKQIKATVQAQTNRLEKVLMNGRRWPSKAWIELFVENPIMHRFATGLIWGVYKDGKLLDTFRYMDDGTFNTVDEEEYTLPEKATITLVHPVELSSEALTQWKEQLDDYEIVQPVTQLTAPIVIPEENDIVDKKLSRYLGQVVFSGKISGIAKKYNFVRGDIWDGGSYTGYHIVDKFLNMACLLNFEYMYMGQDYNDSVTLKEVIFYRLDEEQNTNDEPKTSVIINPLDVPARFLCGTLGLLDQLL